MEQCPLNLVQPGQAVQMLALVVSCHQSKTREGKLFLSVIVRDRSAAMEGKVWDAAEQLLPVFKPGQVVALEGAAKEYNGRLQLTIRLAQVANGANPADFSPPVDYSSLEQSWRILQQAVDAMSSEPLRELLNGLLNDPELGPVLKLTPAAKEHHHAFIGGWAEHTSHIIRLCALVAESGLYPDLNRDLLIAGALCHDIGKAYELRPSPTIEYTVRGHLLGHIVMGYELVRKRIRTIHNFPDSLADQLGHLILSHQGSLEFGSPCRPQTLEALVLHAMDNLDAKMNAALNAVASERSQDPNFTDWVKALEGRIYKVPVLEQRAKENTDTASSV